jgi:hypothetical protein
VLQREQYAELLSAMLAPLTTRSGGTAAMPADDDDDDHQQQQGEIGPPEDVEKQQQLQVQREEHMQQQQQQHEDKDDQGEGDGEDYLDEAAIVAAAGQMVGLLPVDIAGIVADAAAAAAAEAPPGTTTINTQPGRQLGCCATAAAPLPLVRRRHLDTALARVKARTATEIGAPQVYIHSSRPQFAC